MAQQVFFALKSDSLDRFEQVERSKTEKDHAICRSQQTENFQPVFLRNSFSVAEQTHAGSVHLPDYAFTEADEGRHLARSCCLISLLHVATLLLSDISTRASEELGKYP